MFFATVLNQPFRHRPLSKVARQTAQASCPSVHERPMKGTRENGRWSDQSREPNPKCLARMAGAGPIPARRYPGVRGRSLKLCDRWARGWAVPTNQTHLGLDRSPTVIERRWLNAGRESQPRWAQATLHDPAPAKKTPRTRVRGSWADQPETAESADVSEILFRLCFGRAEEANRIRIVFSPSAE